MKVILFVLIMVLCSKNTIENRNDVVRVECTAPEEKRRVDIKDVQTNRLRYKLLFYNSTLKTLEEEMSRYKESLEETKRSSVSKDGLEKTRTLILENEVLIITFNKEIEVLKEKASTTNIHKFGEKLIMLQGRINSLKREYENLKKGSKSVPKEKESRTTKKPVKSEKVWIVCLIVFVLALVLLVLFSCTRKKNDKKEKIDGKEIL